MSAETGKRRLDVIAALALEPVDAAWESTLKGSLPYRIWSSVLSLSTRVRVPLVEKAGRWLETGAFLTVLVLLVATGLPQFASDKEGLALFALAALGLRVLAALVGCKETYRTNAMDMLVVAFLLLNVIATAASHYPLASLKGLAKLVVYGAGYFAFASVLSAGRRRLVLALSFAVATALAVAAYGLYQYKIGVAPLATWEDPTVEVKATRIYSTLGNPNLLAGYLLPLVPVAAVLGLAAACRRKLIWLSVPALAAAGLLAIATVLTGSRGGYIGLFADAAALAAVAGSWLWVSRPRLRPTVVFLVLALPLAVLAVIHAMPVFEHRLMSLFAGWEHSSNAFRLNVWRASWNMFLDNWWIGVGPGNQAFRLAYGLYMRSGFDALGTYCVPLEIAVECGVIGLVIFGLLVGGVLARAHETFWTSGDAAVRWLAAGMAAAIAGMMAHGLVDTVFYRPQVQFLFWIMVAGLVALHQLEAHPPPQPASAGSGKS
ncbi:MAG TPA: O-antigen ligase family protein [Candidatus Obscuribacterales bacterium]